MSTAPETRAVAAPSPIDLTEANDYIVGELWRVLCGDSGFGAGPWLDKVGRLGLGQPDLAAVFARRPDALPRRDEPLARRVLARVRTQPRTFRPGERRTVVLKDRARIMPEPDEQVTVHTPFGPQCNVVRKDWGHYATPSLHGRLAEYGLRVVLVGSPHGKHDIMLVKSRGFEVLEVGTPGRLDAEMVRRAVQGGELDISNDGSLLRVLVDEWDRLGWAFQRFLVEHGLSSHLWLFARRRDDG